jgi:peptide/nickel transport system substrate-binding protein
MSDFKAVAQLGPPRRRMLPRERTISACRRGTSALRLAAAPRSAAFGNAATRLEAFVVKGGAYAYGSYSDIDELFPQQAVELDHKKREAILHKMQQLVHEKVIAAPIWQLAALAGVGSRVGEATIGSMGGYPWLSPYEDLTLKAG